MSLEFKVWSQEVRHKHLLSLPCVLVSVTGIIHLTSRPKDEPIHSHARVLSHSVLSDSLLPHGL